MTNRKIEYWVIPPEADAEFVGNMELVIPPVLEHQFEWSYPSRLTWLSGHGEVAFDGTRVKASNGRLVGLLERLFTSASIDTRPASFC